MLHLHRKRQRGHASEFISEKNIDFQRLWDVPGSPLGWFFFSLEPAHCPRGLHLAVAVRYHLHADDSHICTSRPHIFLKFHNCSYLCLGTSQVEPAHIQNSLAHSPPKPVPPVGSTSVGGSPNKPISQVGYQRSLLPRPSLLQPHSQEITKSSSFIPSLLNSSQFIIAFLLGVLSPSKLRFLKCKSDPVSYLFF
uniref:complexin-4 isoform X1 n=1 Tax=Callithrix jacchus TaxID=9483 RepID=UPI00159DD564|nr:complexin-4 isoform X1 [Callithrix jacchus]